MARGRSTDTPMMQQYLRLKARVPDALLLFRMGDFYELFLDDARIAAEELDLVLTTRDKNVPDPVPMCGLPYHAAETYIRRLLDAGHRVAIAEQVEDPSKAKGLVRRDIVEVVSPGLVANPDRLSDASANYIAAVLRDDTGYGLAYVDVSTGEFAATLAPDASVLEAELDRIAPRELVARDAEKSLLARVPVRRLPDADFAPSAAAEQVGSLPEGLEAGETDAVSRAAAALYATVAQEQPAALAQLAALRRYRAGTHMGLDAATRRHLELVANLRDGGRDGTLFATIDRTRTPMGRRLLVRWLGEPLLDPDAIRARQDRVAAWLDRDHERSELGAALRGLGDLERLYTRACLPTAGPRELAGLRASLGAAAVVGRLVALETATDALRERLEGVLEDEPPAPPRGEPYTGYVRAGVAAEVDRIRAEAEEGQAFLANLEGRERTRTGIATLRVKYNRVFGYSIEVSKAQSPNVPPEYRRKQTTANAERYTTDELERWEGVALRARQSAAAAEARVLEDLRREVAAAGPDVRALGAELGELDVVRGLAEVARENDYVRPTLDRSLAIAIEAGRHPTIEHRVPDGFIPNDVLVDATAEHGAAGADGGRLLILTGPNMAGKSTLLRQVGLITLLAQIGSWVPAASARIGIVDRIFTRVGASDSIATGESTFMVEMRETATILREATERSLVLLDEIGRGTSTFDGLSIAWAVAEYLHDAPGLRPRALFATHYHELADLAETKPGVRNFHFACAERGGEVLFLRRMEPGAASRSYGIEVARHAGLPRQVVRRARQILANLEGGEFDEMGRPRLASEAGPTQLGLFEPARAPEASAVRNALAALDPDTLTPIEALVELARLKQLLAGEE